MVYNAFFDFLRLIFAFVLSCFFFVTPLRSPFVSLFLVAIFCLLLLLSFTKIRISSIEKIQLLLNLWFGFHKNFEVSDSRNSILLCTALSNRTVAHFKQ